ncbi:MAG: protein arginine kinase [Bacillota bacterium]|jgi:protein arginine kinase|nr:protein arginine kinase [Bacillota bacterium]HHT89795.1 protein arginine kinase [Bacillota bacterium]
MKEIASWMKETGPHGDIVLGTRCRLARNLAGVPFPGGASRDQLREVMNKVSAVVPKLQKLGGFAFHEMGTMDALERQVLVEEHLVSPSHTENPQHKAVLLSDEANTSIMVNEEDHLRIQVLKPGLQLEQAWQLATEIDDLLEAQLDYAFDLQSGYLTSCPTNAGTALRASLMFHLPALRRVKKVQEVLGTVSKFGLTVRGLYGEGSDIWGNVFQLSNQITLGQSEEETIEHLARFADQILHSERQAREYLLEEDRKLATEDWLYRSYGILRNARTITSQEAMELLSDLKLGVDLGVIPLGDPQCLKQLMVQIRSAHLQRMMGQPLPVQERDRLRASLLRDTLNNKA